MTIPEAVFGLKSTRPSGEDLEYCQYLNNIIKKIALGKGCPVLNMNFIGNTYEYYDGYFKFTFMDSACGNDHYSLAVNENVWNDIPRNINPMLIKENGLNDVYHFQDSPDRKVLLGHIPGNWFSMVANY